MHGAHEDGAEDDPEERGKPAPIRRDARADDRRGARDGGEVVAEQDVLAGRDVVVVVAERVGRRDDALVVLKDAASDPPGVESIAERERTQREDGHERAHRAAKIACHARRVRDEDAHVGEPPVATPVAARRDEISRVSGRSRRHDCCWNDTGESLHPPLRVGRRRGRLYRRSARARPRRASRDRQGRLRDCRRDAVRGRADARGAAWRDLAPRHHVGPARGDDRASDEGAIADRRRARRLHAPQLARARAVRDGARRCGR